MNYEMAKEVFAVFLCGLVPFFVFVTFCKERFGFFRYSMFSHSIERDEITYMYEVFVERQDGDLTKFELPIYLIHIYGKPFGDLVQESILGCQKSDPENDLSTRQNLDLLINMITSSCSSRLQSIRVIRKSFSDDGDHKTETVSEITVSQENQDVCWQIS
jgi:hypothetical protein